MYTLKELLKTAENYAPLSLSQKMIDIGEYDNSGIIINSHEKVKKVLFSLDLSESAIIRAKRVGADTIITHHPAIYHAIKSIDAENTITSPVLQAIKNNLNVISMHLNLDVAPCGIDATLSEVLGGKSFKIISYLDEKHGYGREFDIDALTFREYIAFVKKSFNTGKVVSYGALSDTVKKVASFCGGGASHAEEYVLSDGSADVIVTSDMPHHVIKEIVEKGKKIIILPHYVAEEKGFKKFYERVSFDIRNFAESYYFMDKRFR